MVTVDELECQKRVVRDKEKLPEILRTLHISLDAFATAQYLSINKLEEIVKAVSANTERRKKLKKWKGTGSGTVAHIAPVGTTRGGLFPVCGREMSHRAFQGRSGNSKRRVHQHSEGRVCHYCGKAKSYIEFCRVRIADESHGQFGKPNSRRSPILQKSRWDAHELPGTCISPSTPHGYDTAARFSSTLQERLSPTSQPTNRFQSSALIVEFNL